MDERLDAIEQRLAALTERLTALEQLASTWVGLRRDERPLRFAGFALLALAVGKVFVYDLARLASIYRVLSLVALGLLLLLAAFAYLRITFERPRTSSPGSAH